MNRKKTLIFVSIAFVLAVFYYAKLHKPSTAPMSAFSPEVAQSFVLNVPAQDIRELSLYDRSKESEIMLKKDSKNTWHVASPVHFPAETLIIDGLVALLTRTPRLRALSAQGVDLKDLGFEEPNLKICVGISKHKDRCLFIGGKSVIGDGAYAKWKHEDVYFLVEDIFLKSFDKTLYSVRKKQIFYIKEDDIAEILFESGKKKISLVHTGKQWTLRGRFEANVAPQIPKQLLLELSSLYVKEFLDEENPDELKSKLKSPARTIRILLRDGSEQILLQGKSAQGKDAYFVRFNQPETVFLISKGKLDHLEETFSAI